MSIERRRPILGGMSHTLLLAASSSWPEAAVAISGIALIGSIAVVVIWQALATWRTRIAVGREEAYRKLAEDTARRLDDMEERLLEHPRKPEGAA